MRITVAKIPEEGLKYGFTRPGEWFREFGRGREDLPVELGPVEVSLKARRTGDTVYLEGTIETTVTADCCRCLEAARLPLAAAFAYTGVPEEERFAEERELRSEDLEVVFYTEDTLDLDPIVYEQILLQIPLKILCREDCRGLCPHCGANLNDGPCRCPEEAVDGRFSVLKKLKI